MLHKVTTCHFPWIIMGNVIPLMMDVSGSDVEGFSKVEVDSI
jgi:hypothetical protein